MVPLLGQLHDQFLLNTVVTDVGIVEFPFQGGHFIDDHQLIHVFIFFEPVNHV